MKVIRPKEYKERTYSLEKQVDWLSIQTIINDVAAHGDRAIRKYTMKFDRVDLKDMAVTRDKFREAFQEIDDASQISLRLAMDNIRIFAQKQMAQFQDFTTEITPGVQAGQRVIPIDRVGIYVPGGNFPLMSTLLMGAIPARVAGVKEIVVCTPPNPRGKISSSILAAAYIAEIDELYTVGGVQAIAAMAYGSDTIRQVNKIVGPGNIYVTAAKKMIYGQVGIDFIAGPSEIMIIADESADESFIAADMLAQAEHDAEASAILVTTSTELVNKVRVEIEKQLELLSTAKIARQSLEANGAIILAKDLSEAIEFANTQAPEHLELQVKNPQQYADQLKNYGSLFIGHYAAEVLGDYSSGINHILPTNGAARYTGGLSVKDFIKLQTTLEVDSTGISAIGPTAQKLAEAEGLAAHANSVRLRLSK